MKASEGIFQVKIGPNDSVKKIAAKLRSVMALFDWQHVTHAEIHLHRRKLSDLQTQNIIDACNRVMSSYTVKPHRHKNMTLGHAIIRVVPEAWK